MTDGWERMSEEYVASARRRGARSFGLGVALLPVFTVIDSRGVVQELLGALSMGFLPAVPLVAWLELAGFIALGVAAARVMSWQRQAVEVLVFAALAAALLLIYALATGAWIVGLLAGFMLFTGASESLAGVSAARDEP